MASPPDPENGRGDGQPECYSYRWNALPDVDGIDLPGDRGYTDRAGNDSQKGVKVAAQAFGSCMR